MMTFMRKIPLRVALCIALGLPSVACDHEPSSGGHSHSSGGHENGGGHNHAGDDHEDNGDQGYDHSSGRSSHVMTEFGKHTELFVEFPVLVAGQPSEFVAHFTELDGYQPVEAGTASVVLTSEASPGERWSAEKPARPGIFTPRITPKYPGERQLLMVFETESFTDRISLGTVEVFSSDGEAAKAKIDEPGGEIWFLKEQQWKVDFDVAKVEETQMRPSVPVHGAIRPSTDADALITAPFDGRLSAPSDGVPDVGDRLEAGDVIAYVVPTLGADEISRLRAEVRKSKVRLDRTERELRRVRPLAQSGAVPQKRVADAESERDLAQADLEQARTRLRQYQNLESRGSRGNGRIAIRTPIGGAVVDRMAVDGSYTASGDPVMRVVDRSQLWLQANVPEADLPGIAEPSGAWFRRPSNDADPSTTITLDVESGDELVTYGEVIDPKTRTVPLTFEIGDSHNIDSLRIGAFVRAHIFSGPPRRLVAVPTSAVLDEQGVDTVFVMTSGESFEKRTVRLGIRDRGRVEVVDGVEPGEVVVSRGVYFVKLAGTSTGSVGHGHSH